jgi:hypothetical protein
MSDYETGWYNDPTGRFNRRYYDGSRWTEHVVDDQGTAAVDPPTAASGAEAQVHQPDGPLGPSAAAAGGSIGADPPAGTRSYDPVGGVSGHELGGSAPMAGPGSRPGGVALTIGMLAAAFGMLLVLLSLLVLPFQSISELGGFNLSLNEAGFADAPFIVSSYIGLGRMVAALVLAAVVISITKPLQLPWLARIRPLQEIANLKTIVTSSCGFMTLWHLLAMLLGSDGVSAHAGAWIGLLGWLALTASQFLEQPLGGGSQS